MAVIKSFYAQDPDYENFVNIRYAMDIEIEKFLAEKLFFNDVNRIVYSSNEMAFRTRGRQVNNQGDYKFPFLNYWMSNYEYDNTFGWYNAVNEKRGTYIEELNMQVRLMPVVMEYEASFWCNRTDELQYALQQFVYMKTNHVAFTTTFRIPDTTTDLKFIGLFNITSMETNPEYKDTDWLEHNKISSIGLNFQILAYDPKVAGGLTLTEEVIFDFVARIQDTTDMTPSEVWEVAKDKITGEFTYTKQS